MNKKLGQLQRQLHVLEKKIKETKRRFPAHSVKPAQMMELFDLEDERERLYEQLRKLERQTSDEEEDRRWEN